MSSHRTSRGSAARTWAAALLALPLCVPAQNEVDILRYSWTEGGGSIRSLSMGQSIGALGADLGNLGDNPAGIGMYRRSDIAINFGVGASRTEAFAPGSPRGQFQSDPNGQVSQMGLVLTIPALDPDWPFFTLGVGYQKRADLNQTIRYTGAPLPASLLSLFRDQANGNPEGALGDLYPFAAGLAWETYLLDPLTGTNDQYTSAIPADHPVTARKEVERAGQIAETNIVLAANFKHRLYLGATLTLPRVYFTESTRLTETGRPDTLNLYQWNYNEDLTIDGNGVQGRFGLLWAASDWLRIGAAVTTPGRIALSDVYSTRMSSRFKTGETYDAASPVNNITYAVRVPGRLQGSAAFLFGKQGVLTAAYERVDHGGGSLRPRWNSDSDAYDYAFENETAANILRVAHNVRLGMEWRIQERFRVRAGVGQEMSPYENTANTQTNAQRNLVSGGFEYRSEKGYAGIAFRRLTWSEDLSLFGPDNGVFALDRVHTLVLIGGGLRF
jgi:hypothetical protein